MLQCALRYRRPIVYLDEVDGIWGILEPQRRAPLRGRPLSHFLLEACLLHLPGPKYPLRWLEIPSLIDCSREFRYQSLARSMSRSQLQSCLAMHFEMNP